MSHRSSRLNTCLATSEHFIFTCLSFLSSCFFCGIVDVEMTLPILKLIATHSRTLQLSARAPSALPSVRVLGTVPLCTVGFDKFYLTVSGLLKIDPACENLVFSNPYYTVVVI